MTERRFITRRFKRGLQRAAAVALSAIMTVNMVNLTVFAMEAKEDETVTITGFATLDEKVELQQFSVGASEEDIVFPDSLVATVTYSETVSAIESTDESEDAGEYTTVSGNDAAIETEETENENNETGSVEEVITTTKEITITGITWQLDASESTGAAFDSCAECKGYCYVYTPVLPEEDSEGNLLVVEDGVSLPWIYVLEAFL